MTPQDINAVFQALAARVGGAVRKNYRLDPFIYGINYLPATASVTTTGTFIVQADSAFAICDTTYVATDTADAAVSGLQPFGSGGLTSFAPFLITCTDSGAGRSLSDIAVPIDSWFGTGQRPRHWPTPKILDPNSTFSVTVQNLSVTDRRVRLAFQGYKIFPIGPGGLEEFIALAR